MLFLDEMVKEKQEIVEENRRKELIKDQQLVSLEIMIKYFKQVENIDIDLASYKMIIRIRLLNPGVRHAQGVLFGEIQKALEKTSFARW